MIYVIDGQGGGVGKACVSEIKKFVPKAEIIALGTNATATGSMLKAGADIGATGENAIIHNCALAGEKDFIIGAMGIIMANALHGEISPSIAGAVSASRATKLLVPMMKCSVRVLGLQTLPIAGYLTEMVSIIKSQMEE